MVFVFAATISKIIYDEVKDYKDKKNGHRRSNSTSSQKARPSMDKPLPLTPPQIEMHQRESSSALSPRSSFSISPIEGRYEMDAPLPPPPAYQAYRAYRPSAVPTKEPLIVKVRSDVVPWSPDDIRMPVEGSVEEDLRRPEKKLFELEEDIKRLEGPQVSELEEDLGCLEVKTQVFELE
jgi:hypothetical protein